MNRIDLVILQTGYIYQTIRISGLSGRLVDTFPKTRPVILETIKHYESEGLLCPTVEISESRHEVTLTYDNWSKKPTKRKFQIQFIHDTDIQYRYNKTLWILASLESIKKISRTVKEYLGDERPTADATS